MLETERAGAKALVVYMDSFERNSEPWKILRAIQADEAHNCALIGKLLEKSATPYSHVTGEFFEKAISVEGRKARIDFLVKGLRWAVREFDQALPGLDEDARKLFTRMRESHLRSIAACEAVTRKL